MGTDRTIVFSDSEAIICESISNRRKPEPASMSLKNTGTSGAKHGSLYHPNTDRELDTI